jgi:site-specific recombinase XerD
MIYKRGKSYWFHFRYNGEHIQKSTHQGNKQVARDAEAAERLRLIKCELGIDRKVKPPCPTLKDFKATFMEWVRSEIDGERTRDFYEACYDRLIDFREFSKSKLGEIDEPMMERFKLSLKKTSKTTANRYLATLRKALRYACRKLKLIDKTPVIELYKHDKDNTVERECEYVYSVADYQAWLEAVREPLRSASILAHDGGICRGELALQWDRIDLDKEADERGFWGTIEIRRGLKRKERRRAIPITEDMEAVLLSLKGQSKCQHVFTSLHDRTQPLSVNTLAGQHRTVMETCSFHPDAGLHALRHSFLTEAGRHTQNVRALQRLAGHSRIQTSMRYVHPGQTDVLSHLRYSRHVQRALE